MVPSRYSTKNPCNQSSQSYVISHWQNSKERELNVQAKVKTQTEKELWLQVLINSGCIHMEIDEQLVKEEQIRTKLADIAFEVFNADRTKNREIAQFVPLEVEMNRHEEQIDAAVTNLNGTDIFLGYN